MKHLLFLILLLGTALRSYGQQDQYFDSDWSIYGRAGVNSAGTRGWVPGQSEMKRRVGFNVGLGYSQAITYGEDIWVNAEIGFSQQGFKFSQVAAPEEPESVQLNYLNIPVFVRYFPFPTLRSVYVGGGPQIGILLDGSMIAQNGTQYILNKNEFSSTDWSGVAMVGVHFAKRADFGLEVRYQHGFTKFNREISGLNQNVVQVSLFFPGSFLMDFLSFGFIL